MPPREFTLTHAGRFRGQRMRRPAVPRICRDKIHRRVLGKEIRQTAAQCFIWTTVFRRGVLVATECTKGVLGKNFPKQLHNVTYAQQSSAAAYWSRQNAQKRSRQKPPQTSAYWHICPTISRRGVLVATKSTEAFSAKTSPNN